MFLEREAGAGVNALVPAMNERAGTPAICHLRLFNAGPSERGSNVKCILLVRSLYCHEPHLASITGKSE
jgi:hypothetical protein